MPASVSFLADWFSKKCALFVRRVCVQRWKKSTWTLAVCAYLGGCAFSPATAFGATSGATRADLDQKIASLNVAVSTLTAATASLTRSVTALTTLKAGLSTTLQATNALNSALVVGGIVTTKSAKTITVPLTFVNGPTGTTAIQTDLLLPSGITFVSAAAGPAATAAAKQVQTALVAGGVRLIVFGLNTTPIPLGVLATVQLTVASTVTPNLYNLALVNQSASDGTGTATLLSATSGTLKVTP